MIIRQIKLRDSKEFLEMCKMLDRQSKFMMFEPEERQTTIEQQTKYINNVIENNSSLILVCEIDHKIVGHLSAIVENFYRIRHTAT